MQIQRNPKIPIQTRMRNKDVIAYLGLWEKLNNENFNSVEFHAIKTEEARQISLRP